MQKVLILQQDQGASPLPQGVSPLPQGKGNFYREQSELPLDTQYSTQMSYPSVCKFKFISVSTRLLPTIPTTNITTTATATTTAAAVNTTTTTTPTTTTTNMVVISTVKTENSC